MTRPLIDRIERRQPNPNIAPIVERRQPAWVERLGKNAKDLTGVAA